MLLTWLMLFKLELFGNYLIMKCFLSELILIMTFFCRTNCYNIFSMAAPFGGYKQSGNGREGGMMGLEDYLETKTLHGLT